MFDWNPADYLPDEGESFEQLSRVREAVAARTPGVVFEIMQTTPSGAWQMVGTVMTLTIAHPDVPGLVHVYWLPESPGAVRVAQAAGSGVDQSLRDAVSEGRMPPRAALRGGGFVPTAGIAPLPHQACFEVVAPRDRAHHATPSLLTRDPEAVAAWVATWHAGATEILHARPAAPARTAPARALSVTWDQNDDRLAAVTSALDVERLSAVAPRTARGALAPKTTMLLAPLGDGADSGRAGPPACGRALPAWR